MRRVVGMPFALANWQVSQVVNAASLLRGTVEGKALTDDEYPKALRRMAMQERDSAAALGTSVHEAADSGVIARNLPDTDERKPFLLQYEDWRLRMSPDIVMREAQVFHLGEQYAGSLDLVADVHRPVYSQPRRFVVDIKTGKGTYTDHAIQLALYMGAQFVGGFDALEGCDVIYPKQTEILEGCDGMAVLHLRPDSWEWVEIPLTDRLAAAALDMVRLARFFMDNPTIDTLKGVTYP